MTMSEQEIVQIATPLMDNLMQASTDIDYEQHVRDFSDRLKPHISKSGFEKMCCHYQADIGTFKARELIAVFRRPDSAALVWRQFMSLSAGEYVAEMVLVHENGQYKVDHALFF